MVVHSTIGAKRLDSSSALAKSIHSVVSALLLGRARVLAVVYSRRIVTGFWLGFRIKARFRESHCPVRFL